MYRVLVRHSEAAVLAKHAQGPVPSPVERLRGPMYCRLRPLPDHLWLPKKQVAVVLLPWESLWVPEDHFYLLLGI